MKIFKLVLLTPTLIFGAFAADNSFDQLMQNAVYSFQVVLNEQNRKIIELIDKVSILEQQLQSMGQKLSDLENKQSTFAQDMSHPVVVRSPSSKLDFSTLSTNSFQVGRFTFSRLPK